MATCIFVLDRRWPDPRSSCTREISPFKIAAKLGLSPGYAGPPNRKSAEVLTKYIITDMYAKAVQGMKAEDAVRWAEGELKKIYEA